MANRVSTFLIIVGAALLGLFVLSIIAHDIQYQLFFFGLLLCAAGGILQTRFPAEKSPESGRFRLVKKKKKQPPAAAPKPVPPPPNHPTKTEHPTPGHSRKRGRDKS